MSKAPDPSEIDVLAPNFKRRLSGVTATVVRLVPLQAQTIPIASIAPALPAHVPQISTPALLTMSRRGPSGARVWHARRNTEMLAGLVLKHLLRKRLKLLFTSASQRRHTGYSKWLIGQMDRLIATSRRTAEYLDRPADVVLHGIDIDAFQPPPDRAVHQRALGLAEGPVIGCFGRIRAQKGTDLFVDTMLSCLKDRPGTAIILGRATGKHQDFERDLRARVAQAGMDTRIRFLGEVGVDQIAPYYQALDLFIAPQRWEGFGLTPLEAMACGVPVIATRVGAFDELVRDGETGALIPADDLSSMIAATRALLDDLPSREAMGQAARAHIARDFSLEREAEALIAIYREMLCQ
ncbi:MAG: glycosyltransferase family 4 protein [Pseudomonadota bacterium]